MDTRDIILFLLGLVTSGVGWWVSTLTAKLSSLQEALAAHKLYAAENYIKDTDLQKLRSELVGHFERLERLVNNALRDRHGSD